VEVTVRVDALLHDLVISVRMLRRTPAFSLTVIATIALGMGATWPRRRSAGSSGVCCLT
jgi:hypothetical protein